MLFAEDNGVRMVPSNICPIYSISTHTVIRRKLNLSIYSNIEDIFSLKKIIGGCLCYGYQ